MKTPSASASPSSTSCAGRVGRGRHKSYCVLVSDNKGEENKQRLKVMSSTSDGFAIAEEDLKLRGPGDFFGSRQHACRRFASPTSRAIYRSCTRHSPPPNSSLPPTPRSKITPCSKPGVELLFELNADAMN